MEQQPISRTSQSGFSLLELLIGMAVTLVIMTLAMTLVAGAFSIRARENQRADALVDAQRALNYMSRDIANSGFGLRNNGIVEVDTGLSAIRVRANLNAFMRQTTSQTASDADEDVQYRLITDANDNFSYIVRLDVNTNNQTTILANRIDGLRIRYYASKVSYTPDPAANVCDISSASAAEVAQKRDARYVVITLCVNLPQRGTPGSAGFQPASRVRLISDVVLRNANLAAY
jgi:prepilin-type N-terminal cleavage/methylation domain-containing protein